MQAGPEWTRLEALFEGSAAPVEAAPSDGRYRVAVRSVDWVEQRKPGEWALRWVLEVVEGEFAGRELLLHHRLVTAANAAYLKRDLLRCGLTLERPSELESLRAQLRGLELSVTRRTRGHYVDLFLEGRWMAHR
jgi:hypothetical protein